MKRRVLFISSKPITPTIDGGQIRKLQSLELLSKFYDIDLLSILPNSKKSEMGKMNAGLPVKSVIAFIIPKWKHYLRALHFIFNKHPIQVNYFYFPHIQFYIDKHIAAYDAIFCSDIRTTQYILNNHRAILKFVDIVDAVSMNYSKAYKKAKGIKRIIYYIDSKRCRNYEKRVLSFFNSSATISSVDKKFMLKDMQSTPNLYIVGNFVDTPHAFCLHNNDDTIVFIGKMSYEPNVLAATYFATHIFPLILKKRPTARFIIVGATPTAKILALKTNNVEVTGYVEDISAYYSNAAVVVAPMLTGAGIQNKILQAMGARCCVVTTMIGAEGLYASENELIVEEHPDDMSNKIVCLLNDRNKRIEMGRNALKYVETHNCRDIIEKQFYNFINIVGNESK